MSSPRIAWLRIGGVSCWMSPVEIMQSWINTWNFRQVTWSNVERFVVQMGRQHHGFLQLEHIGKLEMQAFFLRLSSQSPEASWNPEVKLIHMACSCCFFHFGSGHSTNFPCSFSFRRCELGQGICACVITLHCIGQPSKMRGLLCQFFVVVSGGGFRSDGLGGFKDAAVSPVFFLKRS